MAGPVWSYLTGQLWDARCLVPRPWDHQVHFPQWLTDASGPEGRRWKGEELCECVGTCTAVWGTQCSDESRQAEFSMQLPESSQHRAAWSTADHRMDRRSAFRQDLGQQDWRCREMKSSLGEVGCFTEQWVVLKTRAWRREFDSLLEEFKTLLLNLLLHWQRGQESDFDLCDVIANMANSTDFK